MTQKTTVSSHTEILDEKPEKGLWYRTKELIMGKESPEKKEISPRSKEKREVLKDSVKDASDLDRDVLESEILKIKSGKDVLDIINDDARLGKELEIFENARDQFDHLPKFLKNGATGENLDQVANEYFTYDEKKDVYRTKTFQEKVKTNWKNKKGFWSFLKESFSDFFKISFFRKIENPFNIIKKGVDVGGEIGEKVTSAVNMAKKGKEFVNETSEAIHQNPGVMKLAKKYKGNLANLIRTAPHMKKAEIAEQLKGIMNQTVEKGRAYGKDFLNKATIEKSFPGMSVKQRGGLMVVEVTGRALGEALKTLIREKDFMSAGNMLWETVKDPELWKDAAPIWGSIRSINHLIHNTETPLWSRLLETGLSVAMDTAVVASIVGSLGTATPAILAARTAAGAGIKGLLRRTATKEGLKALAKSSRKFAGEAVEVGGGKWMIGFQLVLLTLSEFFTTEKITEIVIDTTLTDTQKKAVNMVQELR